MNRLRYRPSGEGGPFPTLRPHLKNEEKTTLKDRPKTAPSGIRRHPLALAAGGAQAATIEVDGETCTLVDAIQAANDGTTVGGCTGSDGPDTLVLEPGSVHTLDESFEDFFGPTGLPVVRSTITIQGNGSTIQRNPDVSAFRILAVDTDGDLTLANTLVSGNDATGTGPELWNNATVDADNHNLFGFDGAAGTYGFTPGANDIVPTVGLAAILDTELKDNGGPTLTHALVPDSPAINAANPATCGPENDNPIDQRGAPRPGIGSTECDIGAFEAGEPLLQVDPEAVHFGEVLVGESSSQIVTATNTGNSDLVISEITLAGDSAFTKDHDDPPIDLKATDSLDIDLTFTPDMDGEVQAILGIQSSDQDVDVPLTGVGVLEEIDPVEEIDAILEFFDAAVEEGTLTGSGPGNSGPGRLNALRNIIEAADDLLAQGDVHGACRQLLNAYQRTNGEFPPPDFVQGEAAEELATMIQQLRDDLGCDG